MTAATVRSRVVGFRHAGFLRFWSARVGVAVLIVLVLIAAFGPLLAPHSPNAVIGVPFAAPGGSSVLGTDMLGRDVFSRLLAGGRTLLGLSVLATLLAYVIGLSAGLVAGYTRSWIDPVVMRLMDVLLAFPPLLFLLVTATGAHNSIPAIVIAIGIIMSPGLARIIRAATLDIRQRSYVEAAEARGEGTARILRREILPNIMGVVLADVGIRLTYAILLLAAVNFLGLGLQPPRSDWALMVAENRDGITLQTWVVLAPALIIAALTISINLVADGIARSLGTSIEELAGGAGTR